MAEHSCRNVFLFLTGVSLLAAHPLSAEDKLAPGLVAEFFQSERGLVDFPAVPWKASQIWLDRTIDFDSATEAPPGATLRLGFSIRWTGKIRIPQTAQYNFYLQSDDGSLLFIDGEQIIENGGVRPVQEKGALLELAAGDHDIRVDYFQNTGPCSCKLSWETKSFAKEVVPATALFHETSPVELKVRWWPISVTPANKVFQYTARLWQNDEGLPNNSVLSIMQGHDGYLWVGTQKGLARFDGVQFTLFESLLAPDLKDRPITGLWKSRDGSFWIGTDGAGVVRWKDEEFLRYSSTNGLAGNSVRSIFESRDGSIWIGTTGGLTQYGNGKLTSFTEKEGLLSNAVRSICEDKNGAIWVATSRGLNQLKNRAITAPLKGDWSSAPTRVVCADRQGYLWTGFDYGLTASRMTGDIVRTYAKGDGLADNYVSAIFEDRSGNLWVGSYGGLNRLVGVTYFGANAPLHGGKFLTETKSDGAAYDQVNCIYEDTEGNIWIGSKEGLSRLKPRTFTAYTRQQGLSHNNVMSVYEDSSANVWIATWGGGLNRLADGKITCYTASNGLASDLILSMHQDRTGDLWVGTDYIGGLFRFREGKFIRFAKEQGLDASAVRVIYEDRQGNLWIGTSQALSLFKDGKFTSYTKEHGLAGVPVRAICEDSDGNLWIGTSDGLSRMKNEKLEMQDAGVEARVGEGKGPTPIFTSYTTRDGLSHNTVVALYEDKEKNLWIGTSGGGLNRLRRGEVQGSKFKVQSSEEHAPTLNFSSYTTRDGLFSDDVFEILEDDYGSLWMSCLNGIFRVSKNALAEFDQGKRPTVSCTFYGKADGLTSVQCNGVAKPAGWKGQDGRLWFPTTQGVVVADPHIQVNEAPPPVLVEAIVADKKRMEETGDRRQKSGIRSQESEENLPMPSSDSRFLIPDSGLVIPAGRGELEFHYTALSFQEAEKNRFKYKLEGVDTEWVDAGVRRVAYYNNIYPGNYQFRVIACNKYGVWNESGATVAFVLLPHIWQTNWFRGLGGLAVLGTVAGTVRYITWRKLRRNLERLEAQHAVEKERTRIARDVHDDLGAKLTGILMLVESMERNKSKPADVESQARKAAASVGEVIDGVRAIVWAVNPRNDTLDKFVNYIQQYVETFLQPTQIRYRFELPDRIPNAPLSSEARHNLFLVVKECLNNVVKHSGATAATLRFVTDGQLSLWIEDNGKGFSPSSTPEFGNGLLNMDRRMKNIGGSCEIHSGPGKGTRIHLQIPLTSRVPAIGKRIP